MTDDQQRGSEPELEIRLETSTQAPLNVRSSEATPPRSEQPLITRLRAQERDAAQPQGLELARLWAELCAGTWRFRDTFSTEERYFAVLERVAVARPLRARHLNVFERVLLGQTPKSIAIDQRVAISTVAGATQSCLRRLGLRGRLSNATLILPMAASAARRPQCARMRGRLTRVDPDSDQHWVVSVRRPDLDFPVRLSMAEVSVVRQLVAGRSHAQISGQRATSPRTVANQLATAFRKFGVSGRGAIVQQLIAHSLAYPPSAAGAANTQASQRA
jgi:DNA-binding CsgD family transcriptional regulator